MGFETLYLKICKLKLPVRRDVEHEQLKSSVKDAEAAWYCQESRI